MLRKQAIARASRRKMLKLRSQNSSTSDNQINKKRTSVYPRHFNKIKSWIHVNLPDLIHVKNIGLHLKKDLAEYGYTPNMFTRWYNNVSTITLDELYDIAQLLGADVRDLI